jgi:uncharacterized protein (TIGR00661 family)
LCEKNQTLVYLPFEKSTEVLSALRKFDHPFIFHCGDMTPGQYGNVLVKGFSREGFKESLHSTNGVICNAGFELASEALSLGRKIMVKPLKGQMEQSSNALALSTLGLGLSTPTIDAASIARFISTAKTQRVNYPDVPSLLADWLKAFPHVSLDALVEQAWQGVNIPNYDRPTKVSSPSVVVAS